LSTSLEQVKEFRNAMFEKSMALIDKKGAEEGILVRLSDKFMRLISLTKPGREAAVKDESVLDTVVDIHNYIDYLALMWLERRASK
jgi:hypothetical protein